MSSLRDLLRDVLRGREVVVNQDGTIQGEEYPEARVVQGNAGLVQEPVRYEDVPVSTMKLRTFGSNR